MFRIEIRHAFRMFLTKTVSEIHKYFQDQAPNIVEDYYNLQIDNDLNKEVQSSAGGKGIEAGQELEGSIAFQIRITQEDNQVEIHGYSRHNWEQPTSNKDQDKRWGLLRIPVFSQASKTTLNDKFKQRKIDLFVNISYLEKWINYNTEPKIFGKLKLYKTISGTESTWKDISILEDEVCERLRRKTLLTIQTQEEKLRAEATSRDEKLRAEIAAREEAKEQRAREATAIAETKLREYWQNKAEETEKILHDISRRELPYVRHESDLMGLVHHKEKEHNILRNPRVLEPIFRVVSVEEQNILQEANKPTKLRVAATCTNYDKVDLSNRSQSPQIIQDGGAHKEGWGSISQPNNFEGSYDLLHGIQTQNGEPKLTPNFKLGGKVRAEMLNQPQPRVEAEYLKPDGPPQEEIQRGPEPVVQLPSFKVGWPVRQSANMDPRFSEIHEPPRTLSGNTHIYEKLDYNLVKPSGSTIEGATNAPFGGTRKKEFRGFNPLQYRFPRNQTKTLEQSETIEAVKRTINPSSLEHIYDLPSFPTEKEQQVKHSKELPRERFSQQQDAGNLAGKNFRDVRDTFQPFKASTPNNVKTEVLQREPQDQGDLLKEEMMRNLHQLTLSGGFTNFQHENNLLNLQEQRRENIQRQMSHIKTLNNSINQQIDSQDDMETDIELDNFENIVASTDPALLSADYRTRLEVMDSCQAKLDQVLQRKSRRLQNLRAERISLQHLSRKERGNLE